MGGGERFYLIPCGMVCGDKNKTKKSNSKKSHTLTHLTFDRSVRTVYMLSSFLVLKQVFQ